MLHGPESGHHRTGGDGYLRRNRFERGSQSSYDDLVFLAVLVAGEQLGCQSRLRGGIVDMPNGPGNGDCLAFLALGRDQALRRRSEGVTAAARDRIRRLSRRVGGESADRVDYVDLLRRS